LNDRVKLLAYKIFDPVKAEPKTEAKDDAPKPEAKSDAPKPESKDEPKLEAKSEPKPEAKADLKPEAKAETKPETKTASDLTPQVAKRAYALYEERAGNDGTAVQDWKKAEQEIRIDEAKGEPKPVAKADEPKHEDKAEPKPEAKPDIEDKSQPTVAPQLIKRVHELYEQLGREDVQSVQNWEKAHPELETHESQK
jgi:hypothetical protein